MQHLTQRCESSSKADLPMTAPMMSTPLDDMMPPRQSPQGSHGAPTYNNHMARHLSAGQIPGMDSQMPSAHLASHGSLQHMDGMAHQHSGHLQDPSMGSHMVTLAASSIRKAHSKAVCMTAEGASWLQELP